MTFPGPGAREQYLKPPAHPTQGIGDGWGTNQLTGAGGEEVGTRKEEKFTLPCALTCRNARSRATSTLMQSRALWVNCKDRCM